MFSQSLRLYPTYTYKSEKKDYVPAWHSLLVSLFHTPEVKQITYMSSVVLSSSLQFKEHLSPMPPPHEEDKFPNGISSGHFIA